ncbi:MAG: ABC transporter ATP-binding protein [Syntrophobacteraceae bacterium]|nr:ABC transporter ATP-binding protein [Syntrophobacteraceae bacterium]
MGALLSVENLFVHFGGLTAVNDFSIRLVPGELVGLIGPNGAGKTTIFNVISGMVKPTSGRIRWRDQVLDGLPPHAVAARGIARTFQNIRLYRDMTVLENLMVSFHHRMRTPLWRAVLGFPGGERNEREMRERSMEILEGLGLGRLAFEKAGALAYGQQRRIEIARAIASGPQLLLLDEPAAGMNPQETMELAELILEARKRYSLTLMLIEHDMRFVMRLCERVKVLDHGFTIAEGSPSEIQLNRRVIRAYLGNAHHAPGR